MNEDKSARYHRLRRRASIASTALGVAFLIGVIVSGASAALRDYATSLVGASFIPTLTVYVVLLALMNEAISLPFAFYEGVTLERRYGLSTQTTDYQREAAERLHLPFAILSDEQLAFTRALALPTFSVDGMTLIRRMAWVIDEGVITHVFYPVFPPDKSAEEVVNWLSA